MPSAAPSPDSESRLRSPTPASGPRRKQALDLDLDFFLDAIATVPFDDGAGPRRDPSRYHPWAADAVGKFLERRCGLRPFGAPNDLARPIGRTVERHDGAFYFWRELLASGELTSPFDVVHVDAHADLGLGDPGYRYLMTELLHRPVAERATPDPGQLLESNYLAFAAACRWLGSVTYVTHPARRHDDRPLEHCRDDDANSGFLELKCCDPVRFDADVTAGRIASSVVSLEPAIPLRSIAADAYFAEAPFDVVVLSRSPEYTPAAADALIAVIEAYFDAR